MRCGKEGTREEGERGGGDLKGGLLVKGKGEHSRESREGGGIRGRNGIEGNELKGICTVLK